MAIIRFEYDIDKCDQCPACIKKETLTSDSCALDYYCGIKNQKIAGYIEWDSELPEVPKWCPNRVERR